MKGTKWIHTLKYDYTSLSFRIVEEIQVITRAELNHCPFCAARIWMINGKSHALFIAKGYFEKGWKRQLNENKKRHSPLTIRLINNSIAINIICRDIAPPSDATRLRKYLESDNDRISYRFLSKRWWLYDSTATQLSSPHTHYPFDVHDNITWR